MARGSVQVRVGDSLAGQRRLESFVTPFARFDQLAVGDHEGVRHRALPSSPGLPPIHPLHAKHGTSRAADLVGVRDPVTVRARLPAGAVTALLFAHDSRPVRTALTDRVGPPFHSHFGSGGDPSTLKRRCINGEASHENHLVPALQARSGPSSENAAPGFLQRFRAIPGWSAWKYSSRWEKFRTGPCRTSASRTRRRWPVSDFSGSARTASRSAP